jgi:hypothetical protein
MTVDVVLITNNARIVGHVSSSRFIEGVAQDVFIAARDLVHQGWRLLTHPLYGNFRPSQQPFRSVLLRKPTISPAPVDMDSLKLLEEALVLHALPRQVPATGSGSGFSSEALEDLAFLDMELMKESLLRDHLWIP